MTYFYRDILGLEILHGDYPESIVFFKIAEGVHGHTTVLALFAEQAAHDRLTAQQSALHHFALSLPFEEQSAVMIWYERMGIPYRLQEFPWIGWRGIFAQDPEGNHVELVAFDRSILATAEQTD